MITLIQELQNKALDKSITTIELVRLALYVSRKLKIHDFEKWVDSELNGYSDSEKVPSYRNIPCRLKGYNHIRREWQPIDFEDVHKAELFMKSPVSQPIGELEKLSGASQSKNSMLIIQLPAQLENQLRQGLYPNISPREIALHVDSQHIMGIVDKVRSLILKWGLDLEDAGVKGNGPTFSEQEKQSARESSITYNYYNGEVLSIIQSMENSRQFQANRGSSQSFVQKSFDVVAVRKLVEEISKDLAFLNLTAEKKSEIEADFAALQAQVKSANPKISIMKEALSSLRNIFENIAGELGATILIKLTDICGYIS